MKRVVPYCLAGLVVVGCLLPEASLIDSMGTGGLGGKGGSSNPGGSSGGGNSEAGDGSVGNSGTNGAGGNSAGAGGGQTGGDDSAGGTTGGTGGSDATGGTGGSDATGGNGGTSGSGGLGGIGGGLGGIGGGLGGIGGGLGGIGGGIGGSGGFGGGLGGIGGGLGGMGGSGGATGDGCRVWLAANGSDSNPGTEAAPVATLPRAYDLMCPPPPGGTPNGAECLGPAPRTICVKSGTYTMTQMFEFRKTRMGTAINRLTLQADPNSATRPVFDFSSQTRLLCGENPNNIYGFNVGAHYVTLRNLVVRGANDSCILVQGAWGLIENVLTYECADSGIQISSTGEYPGTGTNNIILNCDSHSNYDAQCEGENADGFAVKEGTGTGNAFIGCRAWDNTDDGFDLFAWTSPVRIDNSWAFDQCKTNEDIGSDCNGFKLGGNAVSAAHILENLLAVGNSRGTGYGFMRNSNPAPQACSGTCASWFNIVNIDSIAGVSANPIGNANVTNMAADTARNADGSLKSPQQL